MGLSRKLFFVAWFLVIASFALGAYFYPILPGSVATHWNSVGQPNGYMPKSLGSFIIPVISLFIMLIFTLIPRIDPLKENIKEFIGYYYGFMVVFIAFMLLVQLQVLLWDSGTPATNDLVIPIALGILFFYAGILVEHAKRNWFIGVRTPWTLSNDRVWDKTNNIGGKLFKICGVIAIIGVAFGEYSVLVAVIPIILVAIFLAIYSYILFSNGKQEQVRK